MSLSQNQFRMTTIKGVLTNRPNFNSLPVQLDVTSAGGVIPGQAVKIVGGSTQPQQGNPKVVEVAADTDEVFGFVNYNYKDATFAALQNLEISRNGNVMFMEANAAFDVNTALMVVVSGTRVATATSGKKIIGRALQRAAAQGDIVAVEITLPCVSA